MQHNFGKICGSQTPTPPSPRRARRADASMPRPTARSCASREGFIASAGIPHLVLALIVVGGYVTGNCVAQMTCVHDFVASACLA